MSENLTPDNAGTGVGSPEPFQESGSGADYDPAASWGAERRLDGPSGGTVPGIEGAPSGAGDGGYGPEGDYAGAAGQANADVVGEVDGNNDALIERAQQLGRPRADRIWVDGQAPDAADRTPGGEVRPAPPDARSA